VTEARRVREVLRDGDRRGEGQEAPESAIPSGSNMCGAHFIVASINIEGKTKFEAELFGCSAKNRSRLGACLDFLEEGNHMLNLLREVGMWYTEALILFWAIEGDARNVLSNASLLERRDQSWLKDLVPLRFGKVGHRESIPQLREKAHCKGVEGFVPRAGRGPHLSAKDNALRSQISHLGFLVPVHGNISPKGLLSVRGRIAGEGTAGAVRVN